MMIKRPDSALVSIFSKNNDYFIPVVELDFFTKKGLHPHNDIESWDLDEDYTNLWNKFQKDFKKYSSLAVLKKYTSTVPSDIKSNVSLYHHIKTERAIKNCNSDELTLITGEFSPLSDKKYILNLRGQSIYTTLFTHALAFKILEELNLDASNLILTANKFIRGICYM